MFIPACLAFFALACSPGAAPSSPPAANADPIVIADAWAPVSPNGVDVGAGYLTLTNNGSVADALITISTPRAQSAEIHDMATDGPVMRMRAVPRLDIPAHGSVTLAPGGMHLMFMGLDHAFAAGESVPLHLVFEHAGARDVALSVRARNEDHAHH